MIKRTMLFAVFAATTVLGACAPLDEEEDPSATEYADEEIGEVLDALPCRDCERDPPPPTHPNTSAMVSIPWGRAVVAGRAVELKYRYIFNIGDNFGTVLRTSWRESHLSASGRLVVNETPTFRFSVEPLDATRCRVDISFNFRVQEQFTERWFFRNNRGDYPCNTAPYDDQSNGANGGFVLYIPDIRMSIHAKSYDRFRVTFWDDHTGQYEQLELDTDDNS